MNILKIIKPIATTFLFGGIWIAFFLGFDQLFLYNQTVGHSFLMQIVILLLCGLVAAFAFSVGAFLWASFFPKKSTDINTLETPELSSKKEQSSSNTHNIFGVAAGSGVFILFLSLIFRQGILKGYIPSWIDLIGMIVGLLVALIYFWKLFK